MRLKVLNDLPQQRKADAFQSNNNFLNLFQTNDSLRLVIDNVCVNLTKRYLVSNFSVLQRIIQCIAEERGMLIEMKMNVAYIPEGEVW